jgi:hypothetical protein
MNESDNPHPGSGPVEQSIKIDRRQLPCFELRFAAEMTSAVFAFGGRKQSTEIKGVNP